MKKKNSQRITFLVLFCFFLIACISSYTQLESASTPDTQATATAIAAINEVSEHTKDWRIVYKERFDSNKRYLWHTYESENELAKAILEVKDGAYVWTLTAYDGFYHRAKSRVRTVSSFHISVDVYMKSGKDAAYGIVFRENEDDYYIFRITDDQYYSVLLQFDDEWITLLDWTKSKAIKPYEINRLTVMGQRTHFYFFINDQFVAEVEDDSIPKGGISFYAGLDRKGDKAVIEFDNVILLAP